MEGAWNLKERGVELQGQWEEMHFRVTGAYSLSGGRLDEGMGQRRGQKDRTKGFGLNLSIRSHLRIFLFLPKGIEERVVLLARSLGQYTAVWAGCTQDVGRNERE